MSSSNQQTPSALYQDQERSSQDHAMKSRDHMYNDILPEGDLILQFLLVYVLVSASSGLCLISNCQGSPEPRAAHLLPAAETPSPPHHNTELDPRPLPHCAAAVGSLLCLPTRTKATPPLSPIPRMICPERVSPHPDVRRRGLLHFAHSRDLPGLSSDSLITAQNSRQVIHTSPLCAFDASSSTAPPLSPPCLPPSKKNSPHFYFHPHHPSPHRNHFCVWDGGGGGQGEIRRARANPGARRLREKIDVESLHHLSNEVLPRIGLPERNLARRKPMIYALLSTFMYSLDDFP
ncbi:hypothetical protein CDAR_203711 [Caerostris darwini]|uniref:Uncharacterized protein n=1 Tax=Caerostris darwini TaxID=1538125 RepID=A0AAV4PBT6_9ARAC|nr:hypothetical protein CDAR_203711 [Caerostris darwini]